MSIIYTFRIIFEILSGIQIHFFITNDGIIRIRMSIEGVFFDKIIRQSTAVQNRCFIASVLHVGRVVHVTSMIPLGGTGTNDGNYNFNGKHSVLRFVLFPIKTWIVENRFFIRDLPAKVLNEDRRVSGVVDDAPSPVRHR